MLGRRDAVEADRGRITSLYDEVHDCTFVDAPGELNEKYRMVA